MNYRSFSRPWVLGGAFGVVLLTSGCGQDTAPSRLQQTERESADGGGETFADSEDVVAMMLAADKLPEAAVSAEELDARQASLMPQLEDDGGAEALVIDTANASLRLNDDDADAREQSDLRLFDTPVKNQGSRPWCTAFATIAAVENLGRRFFGQTLDLSEIHHFKSYNVYQTAPSLQAGRSRGFIDERLWPYYGQRQQGADSKVRAKLVESKKIKLNISDVVAAIRAGEPVVINLNVNRSFMNPKAGGIISPGGGSQGGHAITLTGVVLDERVGGGGYFIIKNSWGSSWGNKGYGYVPFSYCKYSYCYAWSIGDIQAFDEQGGLLARDPNVTPEPSPVPTPEPTPSPTPSPEPVSDGLTAESFKLTSVVKDYRGLLGAHFFVLQVDADQKVLAQVKSVTYKVDGYRNFRAVVSAARGGQVDAGDTMSRSYKLWGWQAVPADATVQLKDGRSFDLKSVAVKLP
jgi:C1A family cysteine protease